MKEANKIKREAHYFTLDIQITETFLIAGGLRCKLKFKKKNSGKRNCYWRQDYILKARTRGHD